MTKHLNLPGAAALLVISNGAMALTTTVGVAHFDASSSVTASQSYGMATPGNSALSATSTNNGTTTASVDLGKFNAATGVLTGVDLQLSSARTQTISGNGYKGNGAAKTVSGSGSSTAALSASGVSSAFSGMSLTGSSCTLAAGGTGNISCTWGPVTSAATATDGLVSVNSANLDDYVGAGTATAALTLPNLSVTDKQSSNAGQANGSSATYTVRWAGDIEAKYHYLLHADASFDGSTDQKNLTLDFGSMLQNSPPLTLSFQIFNLADKERTGLDLDAFVGSGDTDSFSLSLSKFLKLTEGHSNLFTASLLTNTTGTFNAQYLIDLSDDDFGARRSWQNQQLTLNLIGNVAAVPVPTAAWLFGGAMLSLTRFTRRQKR